MDRKEHFNFAVGGKIAPRQDPSRAQQSLEHLTEKAGGPHYSFCVYILPSFAPGDNLAYFNNPAGPGGL